jgi:hypothetical protein
MTLRRRGDDPRFAGDGVKLKADSAGKWRFTFGVKAGIGVDIVSSTVATCSPRCGSCCNSNGRLAFATPPPLGYNRIDPEREVGSPGVDHLMRDVVTVHCPEPPGSWDSSGW